jgi:CheY-like chemotaxis protein
VLLDLRIPKIDGLDVLPEIKTSARLRQIPVDVVTSSTSPEDIQTAYERHANAYLTKPGNFEELRQLIKIVGDFRLKRNCCCRSAEQS